jgi:UDP-glucose 4-epimerase
MPLVLVTGGAGYIGSVAVAELIAAGYQVVVFDNLSLGHRAAVHPDAIFVEGDLANRATIEAAFAAHKPTAVLHFASRSQVGESMQQPFKYLGNNVIEGLNLIEIAVAAGVREFILSSTANLYDRPETIPITENEALIPGSPYGEAKHYLERALYWMERIHGLRYAVLRYFNAAGATKTLGEDHKPETHLIPLVLQVALGQRPHITVFGDNYETRDGTCVRDYIHVTDLARAHLLALQALPQGSRTYNLGNGSGYTVREVIDTARRVTGHAIPLQMGAPRAGDVATLVAGSAKIRAELGWSPEFPELEQIVRSAWDWHRAHPDGYGDRV